MKAAGIDIGSRTIKLVVVEDGKIIHFFMADTTHDPLEQCNKLMAQTSFDRILATGYGRLFLKLTSMSLRSLRLRLLQEVRKPSSRTAGQSSILVDRIQRE